MSEPAPVHRLEYRRPYLYPKQFAAIFDPKRFSLIEATTKAGKTAGCIVWLVEQALAGRPGWNYWWIAPVNSQSDIAFRRTVQAIPRNLAVPRYNKTITLVNGTVIWFKSGDKPDSLYGDDVRAAVIDEASRFKESAFHAIQTTLTATGGPVRIIGNVKGKKNWFYKLARKAEHDDDPTMAYHKITFSDAVEAGVIKAEVVEDARAKMAASVFRELYLAEPSEDGGNPFGDTEVIHKNVRPLSGKSPVAWGWDLGKSVDWTVGIALDGDGAVCRFERFQKPWPETLMHIKRATGMTSSLVDSTGVGDPIVDILQRDTISTHTGQKFTSQSKQQMMEALAVAIQGEEIFYPEGPITSELENFEYEYTRTGVRYSAPEGAHDDCVCALALAHKCRTGDGGIEIWKKLGRG